MQSSKQSSAAVHTVVAAKYWLLFVLLILVMTSTALGVVYTTFESRQLLNDLHQLEEQRNELQVEWGRLQLEQSSMVAQGKVEDTAVLQLNMEVPSMEQVVVLTSE